MPSGAGEQRLCSCSVEWRSVGLNKFLESVVLVGKDLCRWCVTFGVEWEKEKTRLTKVSEAEHTIPS